MNGEQAGGGPVEWRQPGNGRGAPNLPSCRAKPAGFGDYVDCLAARPEQCLFALAFGEGYLCQHPARRDIVARTRDRSPPERL